MEARKQDRSELIYNLRVEHADTAETVGYMIDITPKGMMLIANEPVVSSTILPLRVHLPRNVMKVSTLDAKGELRWCRRRATGKYNVGIRLVEVSDKAQELVDELIRRFEQQELADQDAWDPYLQNLDPSDIE